jgi:hypothetical protein
VWQLSIIIESSHRVLGMFLLVNLCVTIDRRAFAYVSPKCGTSIVKRGVVDVLVIQFVSQFIGIEW